MFENRVVLVAVLSLVGVSALGQECKSVSWTRQVTLETSAEAKQRAVSLLTTISKQKGFGATPAAPGLNELKGRTAVFLSFGRHPKDMLITITDVVTSTQLSVRAYYDREVAGTVEQIASEFVQRAAALQGIQIIEDRLCPQAR